MAELLDVLHQMVQETVSAQKPADVAFGTVTSASPLSIRVEGTMQDIPAVALILTWPVTEITVGSTTINQALQAGDRVVMLRVSKGQRFIVLSRVQGGG